MIYPSRYAFRISGLVRHKLNIIQANKINVAGFTHFVATRRGIFVINKRQWLKVCSGTFFGLTVYNNYIYAFESCDLPDADVNTTRGRLIRLTLDNTTIVNAEVLLKGLSNGCHQIDFVGENICILDTYKQRVLVVAPTFDSYTVKYPLPPVKAYDWAGGYAHLNSFIALDDSIYLLAHGGANATRRPSELIVTDLDWNVKYKEVLPGVGCHNVVVLEDGTILICDSLGGGISTHTRFIRKIDNMMTRGLSVDQDEVVVGVSQFVDRRRRSAAFGRVIFLDRNYNEIARLDLPFAPADIRRIDGNDYSLSVRARELSLRSRPRLITNS